MEILISFLSIITVIVVVNFVFELISNAKEKQEVNIVRLPKIYAIIGLVCFIAFLAIIIAYILTSNEHSVWFILLFSIFLGLCIFLVISALNWRIKYNDEKIEYRTMFRHTLNFRYSDIVKVHRTRVGTILIKVKKRYLTIDPYSEGKADFLEKVYIKMIKANSGYRKKDKKK